MDLQPVLDFLMYFTIAVYVLLAILSIRHWIQQPSRAGTWIAVTFIVLAVVSVLGLIIPEEPSPTRDILVKIDISILLLFPYFLYLFSATFRPMSVPMRVLTTTMTVGMITWTLFLPPFPEEGAPTPSSLVPYLIALLVDWTTLSTIMAVRLWRGGSNQPAIARRRMRLMSLAAGLLSLTLIISGIAGGTQPDSIRLLVSILGLTAVLTLYLGYNPPKIVRTTWRRPAQESMRRAITDLMIAESDTDVARGLLPHAAQIVGARGVAYTNEDDDVIDSHHATPEMLEQVPEILARPDEESISKEMVFRFPSGSLVVWASPYAPFFGTEEREILQSVGVLANLAIERARAQELKLQVAEAHLRRKQALQLNDDVVQGLAVAKYSFELGQDEKGLSALADTLEAAKRIISDLLKEIEPDLSQPGALIRDTPSTTARDRKTGT